MEGNGAEAGVAGGVRCTKGAQRVSGVVDEASCADGLRYIENGSLEVEACKSCATSITAAVCGTTELTPIESGDDADVGALITR